APPAVSVIVPPGPTQVAAAPRRPWRRALAAGIVAAGCLLVAGAVAAFLAGRGPRAAAPGQPPPSPTGQVLYVLPSRDFWYPDYENVAQALRNRNLRMQTVSSEERARHDPAGKGHDGDAHDLTPDYLLH